LRILKGQKEKIISNKNKKINNLETENKLNKKEKGMKKMRKDKAKTGEKGSDKIYGSIQIV